MTFMIPTPATVSETEAIPTRARVRTVKIWEKVDTIASWVMTVTSSARWRSASSRSTPALAAASSPGVRTSTRIRNSELRLNIRIAVATGTWTTSSKSKPSVGPRGAMTPTTRKRHPPTRTTLPSALSPPNSSRSTVAPSTISLPPRSGSPGER